MENKKNLLSVALSLPARRPGLWWSLCCGHRDHRSDRNGLKAATPGLHELLGLSISNESILPHSAYTAYWNPGTCSVGCAGP